MYTRWVKHATTTPKVVVFLAKTDKRARDRLLKALKNESPHLHSDDPLWFYTMVLEQVAYRHHETVKRVRGMIHGVKEYDELAPAVLNVESTSHDKLYQTAWHASTAVEILEADMRSLADMINTHEQFLDSKPLGTSTTRATKACFQDPIHRKMLFASQMLHNMRLRCMTYKERANNDSE